MNPLGFFKKALPWIVGALPIPGIAQKLALEAIGAATGKTPKDADEASDALHNATPGQLAALKAADQAFAVRMRELGIQEVADLARLTMEDRSSARAMQTQLRGWTMPVLTFLIVIVTVSAEGWVLIHGLPRDMTPDAIVIVGRILGTLDAALMMVLGFHFGSSAGSDKKNALIEKLTTE